MAETSPSPECDCDACREARGVPPPAPGERGSISCFEGLYALARNPGLYDDAAPSVRP